jgi:hypothetical protein
MLKVIETTRFALHDVLRPSEVTRVGGSPALSTEIADENLIDEYTGG